jgi:hypothetical protein
MSQRKIYEWVEKGHWRRTSADDVLLGRLPTVACVQLKKEIGVCILDIRRMIIDESASEMSISHGQKRWEIA